MATIAATNSEKIILNFAWSGPNIWHGGSSCGGLDILIVDLLFKDAKTEISVPLRENITSDTVQKFPFRCRKYTEKITTSPESLRATKEQVNNLVIKAGFFEKGRPIGPKIMHPSGRVTQQNTLIRSDRDIKLELPEELESGKTYDLVVSSDVDLNLSAVLVKK